MALSVYVFTKPFGSNKEGDRIDLEPDDAQALLDSGVLAEATQEDVEETYDAEEEMPEQEAALVTRSVNRIRQQLEKGITRGVEAAINKTSKSKPVVPATVKTDAVFKSTGDLMYHMWRGTKRNNNTSRNMLTAYEKDMENIRRKTSPLGMNEGTASQGGYDVKPVWLDEVWDKIRDYPHLGDLCNRIAATTQQLKIPTITENSLSDGSRHGGVRAYYVSEGDTATSSLPAGTTITASLQALVILSYVTLQLLEDGNVEAIDKLVTEMAMKELLWREGDAVINGSGSGQPKGILNQSALVTVTKSTNDSAAMFGFRDLANMYRSLWAGCRANAVWLVNPEAAAVLLAMVFEPISGSATTYPAFGGVSYNAADDKYPLRIFGKPVIECPQAPQLGSPGDIILVDPSQLILWERPGVQVDFSDQVQFTTLQIAYRFVKRWDIQCPWNSTVTSVDGNYTYAPAVILQSRGT